MITRQTLHERYTRPARPARPAHSHAAPAIQRVAAPDGTVVSVYTSALDGRLVVQIDTSGTIPNGESGEKTRVYHDDEVATNWEPLI